MPKPNKLHKFAEKWAFNLYLASLILFVVLPPFYYNSNFATLFESILLGINLIASGTIIDLFSKRRVMLYLSIFTFGGLVFNNFFEIKLLASISRLAYAFIAITSFIIIFRIVFKSKMVNRSILFATISGYLLMGIFFGIICYVTIQYQPNAYTGLNNGPNVFYDMLYYSFVSLTTLGYGDISPITPQAKSIAMLISLTGQLYLTIMVAIIVGKYISNSNKG